MASGADHQRGAGDQKGSDSKHDKGELPTEDEGNDEACDSLADGQEEESCVARV